MNINKVLTKDYGNVRLHRGFKNKAKQTQFKPKTKPKQTQFAKMLKINVTSVLTKDYENDNAFRPHENKANQSQKAFTKTNKIDQR